MAPLLKIKSLAYYILSSYGFAQQRRRGPTVKKKLLWSFLGRGQLAGPVPTTRNEKARQNAWLLNAEEEGFEPNNTILPKGIINAIYTYIWTYYILVKDKF
ncbi:hypothetical protein SAMN04488057_11233 [Cyclobacterium lianum]|uniref:Uncharacterized protein n=1 Tax=Cyclobacterium lianum TaxID=388280 RepID=A0A1M7PYP9_9BACT|nr:hypothetical protein [Cyclobacterium lianum]SHN22927.1 hypothetical protein SAMN04488057_11233 [Cyclobacterium lianum]